MVLFRRNSTPHSNAANFTGSQARDRYNGFFRGAQEARACRGLPHRSTLHLCAKSATNAGGAGVFIQAVADRGVQVKRIWRDAKWCWQWLKWAIGCDVVKPLRWRELEAMMRSSGWYPMNPSDPRNSDWAFNVCREPFEFEK